mmetsp:Transcript_3336/g.5190  ORF Transcript_3336/g.5190 Transcript_3336/m.5190 type:complete len:213 (-) Transcript_3336:60-698(-)|eukprot:CAMPEP_0171453582 /NCGR_PEP_ID=MMETSP0945-20130129/1229_1 /TAXON_ID=109269 /ORGANISM="Vaucheria litorea, Strain CCMP2940" /LENGTH=212 /DNA_ID=CAMNT_0011978471 /DNA_START=94 /DNA_END=732 /DNA_ORIENTATION=+
MAEYGNNSYWDDRYENDPEPFDWYQRYNELKDILNENAPKESQVLVIGCGNSSLSKDMVSDGYELIMNIDISKVVIDQMILRHEKDLNLKWKCMDALKMDFENESFQTVIDKGTLDSIMCGDNASTNSLDMCMEINRVLKPGGKYIVITYGTPDTRLITLQNNSLDWHVTMKTVQKPYVEDSPTEDSTDEIPSTHYIYICHKAGKKDDERKS